MESDGAAASNFGLDFGQTELRIIASARKCFETTGVAKTRMDDIASEAGLSRQTVYKYFSGKEDIINRIGHLEMVKVNQIVRSRLNRERAFPEKITEAIVLSVEVSLENPYLRKVIEDAELMPRYHDKQVSLFAWQREQWASLIENARSTGQLAEDLDLDRVVQWILISQLLLLLAYERIPMIREDIRVFVRRFMVEPLLSHRAVSTSDVGMELAMLREENSALKDLVSRQALELHGIRNGG